MMSAEGKPTCFVIGPMGSSGSEQHNRANEVLEAIVRPAAETCGYRAVRADEIAEPGRISLQVIQHLVEDPMVVADLTGLNSNVLYELGWRHALGKPCVLIAEKGEELPFDVADMRIIYFDSSSLISSMQCRQRLAEQIEFAASNPNTLRQLFLLRRRKGRGKGRTKRRVRV